MYPQDADWTANIVDPDLGAVWSGSALFALSIRKLRIITAVSMKVWHILSCYENISTAILPLPLIQEEQLSVTGERMCTKDW